VPCTTLLTAKSAENSRKVRKKEPKRSSTTKYRNFRLRNPYRLQIGDYLVWLLEFALRNYEKSIVLRRR
jgi:hypothetical protein